MKNKSVFSIVVSLFILVALCFALPLSVTAYAKVTDSSLGEGQVISSVRSGVLMDAATGTVVLKQNEKVRYPIASMVKIMTILRVFEEVEKGTLSLNDDIIVSENAAGMGGSQAFLDSNASYKLNELIKSAIVASANDSCVALAERISGSVSEFVKTMNLKAKDLGMSDTNFVNCTGLPADGQFSCAMDAAKMFKELIKHDKFFDYSRVWYYDIVHPGGRTTRLTNTNKLINGFEGCDGGKTGFTKEAKYCLSATAKRGETRLISVVLGAETSKERNAQIADMFNYGFANYESKQLISKDEYLKDEIAVAQSKIKTVKVRPENNYYVFGKKNTLKDAIIKANVDTVTAPKISGDKVGELQIILNGETVGVVNLVIDENLNKVGYLDIVNDIISNW